MKLERWNRSVFEKLKRTVAIEREKDMENELLTRKYTNGEKNIPHKKLLTTNRNTTTTGNLRNKCFIIRYQIKNRTKPELRWSIG